jgi:hypothetical protein
MATLYLVLYIFAAVCFALSALGVVPPKVQLLALGLLAWVLVPLVQQARHL